MLRTGAALLDIVYTERLDFSRSFPGDHLAALTGALADAKVPEPGTTVFRSW